MLNKRYVNILKHTYGNVLKFYYRKKRQGGSVPGLKNIVKGAQKGVQRGKARNKKGGIKSKKF